VILNERNEKMALVIDRVRKQSAQSPLRFNTVDNLAPTLLEQYKDALNIGFNTYSEVKHVIILEEDLLVSHDAITYFMGLGSLLDSDNSLFAIRAWSDNGFPAFSKDTSKIFRSEVFVGLGWCINKKTWKDLIEPQWPPALSIEAWGKYSKIQSVLKIQLQLICGCRVATLQPQMSYILFNNCIQTCFWKPWQESITNKFCTLKFREYFITILWMALTNQVLQSTGLGSFTHHSELI
jgi:hypothetical protein